MWIKQVELKNIKSYGESQTIRFALGVNAICGQNGAGKSTILEAVGLALFDVSPYKPKSLFVREDEKQGEIVVTIVDALDERKYQIVHPLGRGKPYIFDPEIKKKLCVGRADVRQWLKDHLRVAQTIDLQVLFADAVGVRQGLLTAPFLETSAANRKKKFNPLLQVDEYEKVWSQLLETTNHVRDKKHEQEKRIAGLSGKLERLPELEQECERLRLQIAANQTKIDGLTARLKDVNTQKEALDERKENLAALEQRLAGITTQLNALNKRLADAETAVQQATNAKRIVAKAQPGHEAYTTAQNNLAGLEIKRHDRDTLRQKLAHTEKELAAINQKIVGFEENLTRIAIAEARLTELAPLVAQQEQLEGDLQEAKQNVAILHNAQNRLIDEKKRLETLQAERDQVQTSLQKRKTLEEKAANLSAKHKQHQANLTELNDEIDRLEATWREANSAVKEAENVVREWQTAQQRLLEEMSQLEQLQTKASTVNRQLAQRRDLEAQLEALESDRQQKGQELARLQGREPLIKSQQDDLNGRLTILQQTDAANCPVCQEPLSSERAHELAIQYQAEQNALTEELEISRNQQASLATSLKQVEGQIRQITSQLAGLPHAIRQEEVQAEIKAQEDKVIERQAQVQALADAPQKEATARTHCQKIEDEGKTARQRQKGVTQTVSGIGQRITAVQDEIAHLPHPERVREIEEEIGGQETAVIKWQDVANTHRNAPNNVASLETQLEKLGDPRQDQQRMQAKTDERPNVEKRLANAQTERDKFSQTKANIGADLDSYASLDADIAAQKASLQEHEDDYNRYMHHLQMAETVPERETKLAEVHQEQAQKLTECEQIKAELIAAQTNYDEEQHNLLQEEQRELGKSQATLTERLKIQRSQVAKLGTEISDLHKDQVELTVAEQEDQELSSLAEAMTFIRKTIREAGPHITRRLVQRISHLANNIFSDIMANHIMQLEWDEEYAISVTHQGEKRVFQQLSGGEQMAAALAVRLALLREISNIRIAFFDEPTAHLDEERRENLAQQITRIKGFKQLFIISHDDTFERETHHVIHVAKENGLSKVTIG